MHAREDDTVEDLDQDDMLDGKAWKESEKHKKNSFLPLFFAIGSDITPYHVGNRHFAETQSGRRARNNNRKIGPQRSG